MIGVVQYYYQAKKTVYDHGFYPEIYWQEKVNVESINAQHFLSEHAWVVLSSGMNVKVVEKIYASLSSVFNHWKDIDYINNNKDLIRSEALKHIAYPGKIEAILFMANYVSENELNQVVNKIREFGSVFLEQFPFLGPATSKHFAKNIGLNIAKPDRHLVRISKMFGHTTDSFCGEISKATGDKMCVVDIVLWRYATINKRYLHL